MLPLVLQARELHNINMSYRNSRVNSFKNGLYDAEWSLTADKQFIINQQNVGEKSEMKEMNINMNLKNVHNKRNTAST